MESTDFNIIVINKNKEDIRLNQSINHCKNCHIGIHNQNEQFELVTDASLSNLDNCTISIAKNITKRITNSLNSLTGTKGSVISEDNTTIDLGVVSNIKGSLFNTGEIIKLAMEKLKQTYIYNIGSQFISIVSKDELDTFNGFLFESLGGSSINAEFVVPNNQKVKLMNKSGIITKMKARLCVRDAYNNFGELSHLKTMESVEFVGIDVFDSKIVPNVTKIHKGMLNLNLMSAGRFKVLILRDNIEQVEQGVFNDKIELNMVVLGRNIRKVGDDLIQLIKRTKSKVYIVRNSTTNDILREHLRDVLVEYVDSTDDAIQQIEDKKKTAIKQYNRIKALATVNNIYTVELLKQTS